MDNVDETLHATLEANLENGVNKRLKPEESEADCRIGNNLEGNNMEGNNLEGNHHESQEDHFHQEEMSEGSEVVFNIIISHDKDNDNDDVDGDDDDDDDDDDNQGDLLCCNCSPGRF